MLAFPTSTTRGAAGAAPKCGYSRLERHLKGHAPARTPPERPPDIRYMLNSGLARRKGSMFCAVCASGLGDDDDQPPHARPDYRVLLFGGDPPTDDLWELVAANPAVTYLAEVGGELAPIFVSEGVTAWLGWEPQQFLDDRGFFLRHIHPDDRARVLAEADAETAQQVGVGHHPQPG